MAMLKRGRFSSELDSKPNSWNRTPFVGKDRKKAHSASKASNEEDEEEEEE